MKILIDNPPNIEDIKKVFTFEPTDRVIFTYGDTIYNPGGYFIEHDLDLIAHEATHTRQQGNDPEGWWKRYLEDKDFRLSQEIEAYRVQYKVFRDINHDRNAKARFINYVAHILSGHIYGYIISYKDAVQKII